MFLLILYYRKQINCDLSDCLHASVTELPQICISKRWGSKLPLIKVAKVNINKKARLVFLAVFSGHALRSIMSSSSSSREDACDPANKSPLAMLLVLTLNLNPKIKRIIPITCTVSLSNNKWVQGVPTCMLRNKEGYFGVPAAVWRHLSVTILLVFLSEF